METFCGSKHFMAPEMFKCTVKYDETIDIFALGVVFKTMYDYAQHKDFEPRVKGEISISITQIYIKIVIDEYVYFELIYMYSFSTAKQYAFSER